MSYQVLARKWRPRLFREMVGQTHVLQALINALDHDRLHHAYLFTGTRGVGKTTVARILAKCLNCESGVSSEPCGVCSACKEIDEGRFVDLIEVDAASRTKVEDTRELLDNVQYAPSRGRFKVYLIDEVHMLSSHSFNALLKTLEEPPAHVKFLLATTDPQKLPVTILSRCLQFSLKNMLPEKVVEHLRFVLGEEHIPFDEESLWLLGRAADGSMRDGLSLTDQAIAFGNGALRVAEVRNMLGTIDHSQVFGLLETLARSDAKASLALVAELAEQGADFAGVLAELISTLQRLAVAQVVPEAIDNSLGDQHRIVELAGQISAEDVQLFYQLALHGRRDLPLSPDPRGGFEMALLRMMAFKPGTLSDAAAPPQAAPASGKLPGFSQARAEPEPGRPAAPGVAGRSHATPGSNDAAPQESSVPAQTAPAPAMPSQATKPVSAAPQQDAPKVIEQPVAPAPTAEQVSSPIASRPLKSGTPVKPPYDEAPAEWLHVPPADDTAERGDYDDEEQLDVSQYLNDWQVAENTGAATEAAAEIDEVSDLPPATDVAAQWLDIFTSLRLSGLTQSIAAHCQLIKREPDTWALHLDPGHSALYNENHRLRIEQAVADHVGAPVTIMIEVAAPTQETPAIAAARRKVARQKEAETSIQTDPLVQSLVREFAAQICDDSIRPLDA
ncbi:DNA polymerase III subunit gamma/tau [Pseudomonas sp. OIL-1]|uniref:DNA polymerase III subunit gamma/tau n=1 Tax=Pseudomonas sp. OIL-1 TaxID=2706126 RepID=UPI0013A75958|nr:DNA polymerase III subunit gamma/tau [Pseudomonas sp. OIL-1]QIB51644.1 DNA polymerase III subunit gamma/tau [Pseudomonas sp. OIL-1]